MMLYNKVSVVMLTIMMTAIFSEASAQENKATQEVEIATNALINAIL